MSRAGETFRVMTYVQWSTREPHQGACRVDRKRSQVNLILLATVFGVVFVGELPDKTMFASLLLAARGRAGLVWFGAAVAFLIHVAIAVTVGGLLVTLLPHRVTQLVVAALFLVGAIVAFLDNGDHGDSRPRSTSGWRTLLTAFVVIFLAEWGDLTQILTANLAARYDDPFAVGIAATLALWAVAALAVLASRVLGKLPVVLVRRITGVMLLGLAAFAAIEAVAG